MGPQRDPDWMRTLDEVEQAVRGCLIALDRYEERFRHLLEDGGPSPRGSGTTSHRPAPSDATDAVFAARLAGATAEADAVEVLLAEQEAVWGRWQRTLAAWRQSLEQQSGLVAPTE